MSSVKSWRDVWETPAVAARRSPCFESRPGDASAWIRQGESQAYAIECAEFDKKRFKENLYKIRALTREPASVFEPEMKRLCAEAGVAVASVKEMKKVPWNGATRWLTPRKAMILLSLRGKREDKFWFSFFHEAGHVLNDGKKDLLINDGTQNDPREKRADACRQTLEMLPGGSFREQAAGSLIEAGKHLARKDYLLAGKRERLLSSPDESNLLAFIDEANRQNVRKRELDGLKPC